MVRREQWEKIKNRLENFRAVPKWEVGDAGKTTERGNRDRGNLSFDFQELFWRLGHE